MQLYQSKAFSLNRTKILRHSFHALSLLLLCVTFSIKVFSQEDVQRYRSILSELANSRCKNRVCDCRDDTYEIIRKKDSLDRLRNLNPLPYPISANIWGLKYEELCLECQRKHTIAKQNFFLSDPGILKFILDSIEKFSYTINSYNKVQNKCYWVENDYSNTYSDSILSEYFYYDKIMFKCNGDIDYRLGILGTKKAGLILIYNYLTCQDNCNNANITIPMFLDMRGGAFLKIFTLEDIKQWLSDHWGTAEEMRKKYQQYPLPLYKILKD
ncbi:MAG: hypothetical protein ACK5C0_03145 [Candidatus Kapaibacterium sp.]|jgi:hypothetical protein